VILSEMGAVKVKVQNFDIKKLDVQNFGIKKLDI
jgi:hypothetical protein